MEGVVAADIGAMTVKLYGEDTKPTRKRVHQTMYEMAKRGSIKKLDDGQWTIATP